MVKYKCVITPEDSHPRNHFGYETESENNEAVQAVLRLAETTDWGWCQVRVLAEFWGFTGFSSYLGGCSYKSEADFRGSKFTITGPDGSVTRRGYFGDLCDEALADLREQIENVAGRSDDEANASDVEHGRAALAALNALQAK